MGVEVELVVYCDSQVFCCVGGLEGSVVDLVDVVQFFFLVCDLDDLTFLRVKFHLVVCFPCLECVEV